MMYLAGSTGVLALNPARLLRGLTSSGLWLPKKGAMAGILPRCTAREFVQSSKTWVPKVYRLITAKKVNIRLWGSIPAARKPCYIRCISLRVLALSQDVPL